MSTATSNISIIASLQDRLSKPLMGIEKSTGRMEKQFTKLSGAVQNAFQFYVRYRIFGLINQGISAIENAIPGLIARGQEWAQTVDDIADSSGLAAEKSSLLAGIVQVMTGDTDKLVKALGALSQQAVNHGDVMKRYGIETRTANGQLLDSWTILQNVRKATSDLGNSFITTAAARDLFSRGGQTLLDFLTMSDAQFKLLTQDVKESGVIMSEAGLQAAEQWQRTQQRFEQQVTGIANQITQGVQPLLSRLVDGITNYLRQNMAQIVGFVTGVVSFVAGAIAGFLGIDISGAVKTMAEQLDAAAEGSGKRERALSKAAKTRDEQTASEDGYTVALNRQIEAIDRQLAAMAKADNAEDARREHARLLKDIAEANKELRDLRGEGIFAAGMSNAEAELARQAQAADIMDAQKKVREAQQKIAEQERDTARENRRIELTERKEMLQQRLADHMKTIAAEAAASNQAMAQIFGKDKGGIGALSASLAGVGDAVKTGLLQADVGTKWGEQFRGTLEGFLDDLNDPTTGLGDVFASLASIARTVATNWDKVALAGAAIIGLNLGVKFLALSSAIVAATAALPGAGAAGAAGVAAGAAGVGTMTLSLVAAAVIGKEISQAVVGRNYGAAQPVIDDINKAGDAAFARLANASVKTLQDTANTLFGPGTFVGGLTGANAEEMKESISALGFGIGPTSQFQLTQVGIGSALAKDGPIMRSLATTSGRLAPSGGRSLASWSQQTAMDTRAMLTRPLGTATVNVIVDGRTLLSLMGIPLPRSGNSTTRISPSQ